MWVFVSQSLVARIDCIHSHISYKGIFYHKEVANSVNNCIEGGWRCCCKFVMNMSKNILQEKFDLSYLVLFCPEKNISWNVFWTKNYLTSSFCLKNRRSSRHPYWRKKIKIPNVLKVFVGMIFQYEKQPMQHRCVNCNIEPALTKLRTLHSLVTNR